MLALNCVLRTDRAVSVRRDVAGLARGSSTIWAASESQFRSPPGNYSSDPAR